MNPNHLTNYIDLMFWVLLILGAIGAVFMFIMVFVLFRQDNEIKKTKYPSEANEKLSMYYEAFTD